MTVETATDIDDLNDSLPDGSDAKSEGDDHIRLIKAVLQASFAGSTWPRALQSWADKTADTEARNSNDNILAADDGKVFLANASGGAFQLTLLAPASASNQFVVIKKIDATANAVTVAPSSGTIDGVASISLVTQYDFIGVWCDGTAWYVVGRSPQGVSDHGALLGLGDDDHSQYHNNTRGDARYFTQAQVTSALAGKSDTSHNHAGVYDPAGTAATAVSDHESTYDHDAYDTHVASTSNPHSVTAAQAGAYTSGETDALLADKQDILSEGEFVDGDKTKLDGIATGAVAEGATGDAYASSHESDTTAHPAANITVAATPSNYSAASGDVEDHLAGIDAAFGALPGGHDPVTVNDSDTIDLTLSTQDLTADARTQMSITSDASGLKLSGDSATPGNDYVYGTDGAGTKGWNNNFYTKDVIDSILVGNNPGTIDDDLEVLAADPFLAPFAGGSTASDQAGGVSAFKRPIGTSVTTSALAKPITAVTVNHLNNFTRWVYLATRDKHPLKTIAYSGWASEQRDLPWDMHIADGTHGYPNPYDLKPSGSTRDSLVNIMTQHPTRDEWNIAEFYGFHNIDGNNNYQTTRIFSSDPDVDSQTNPNPDTVYGPNGKTASLAYTEQGHLTTDEPGTDGLPKWYVAASNISSIYSIIRQHEIETTGFPIRHPILIAMSPNTIRASSGTSPTSWAWPATSTDGAAAYDDANAVPMGALLTIPTSVDVTTLGLGEKGLRIARAIQRYGLIVSDSGSNHATNPSTESKIIFCLEESCAASTKTELDAAFAILFPSNPASAIVELVTNSVEAQSVSGGGSAITGATHWPTTWNDPGTGHTVTDGTSTWRFGAVLPIISPGTGGSVPTGGIDRQFLVKASDANDDTEWAWPDLWGYPLWLYDTAVDTDGSINYANIVAGIAAAKAGGFTALSLLPAGVSAYVDGSFKLAGPHTSLDGDNGSGDLIENWVVFGNGVNLMIPPSPTLANFEDQHSPVLDGSDYAFCSDFFVHDGEPWQWGPGINKSTKVGQASFSASGSDFTYATAATVLGMAVENGGVMSRLLQVSRLDYDGETVTPTGTTAVGATSGATARVVRIVDNGTTGELWLTSVKGTFQDDETVNLFTIAGAAAGTVVANGTLDTQPTTLADGEWALNSGGVRVGTRTTGDTFWLVTEDAGNIIDQGGRLRDYKVFIDLCGTARVHFVGKLILTCQSAQDIIAIGTSRQGPKDSNNIKSGGRANIYDDIVIVDAPIGLSTNPIGGAVWDASSQNNEDGQCPSFSMAIFHKLTMSGVIRPFAVNSDRGDSFRIGQMETTAVRARSHFHNINAQIDTWRGTFNSEADAGTSGQSGHDEPVLEVSSADVQIGSMFFHSSGATPATAGAYGLIHMANSSVFVGDLKHDNTAGRTNRPYLITMDNTLNGFSRGKVQRLHAVIDSNASLGNITGWLDAFVLLVTHSYAGTTRDSRNIYVEASMIEAADVPGIAISGSDTTKDLIEVSQRDTNQHYLVVAGTLVACDANGLRHNFAATSAPTVTDDADAHYGVGSRWIYTTTGVEFVCVDATAGAAVWKVTTAGDAELYAAAFGVVADGVLITDAAITSGDTELTSASNPFTAADVGKPIHVAGAGAAGVTLRTTIATYNSAGSVELTASASTTVSADGIAGWGTDNSTALIAMRDYMIARRETDFTVHMQSGTTCYTNNRWLQDIGGVRLIGAGSKLHNLSADAWEANYRPFNNRMVWDADGDVPVDGDRPFYNGYGFADADIGDTTLTMTSSGDESNFSAGERVYIQGFCQQAGGYPPNPRYFEYNVIESIGSGTITLKNPIKHDYRDTEWFDQTYAVDAQNVTYGKARIMSLERAEWYFPRLIELNGIEIQTVDPAIVGAVTLAADKFVVVDCKTPALAIGMNRIAEIERTEVYAYSIEPDKNVEYCRIQDCDIVGVVEATGVEQLSILGNRILGKINSAPRVLVVERNQIWTTDTAGPIQLKAGSWAINHVSVKDNIIHDATTLNATVVIGASPSFTVGSAGANDEIKVTANTTNITNVVAKIVPGSFLYQSDLALYGRVLSIVDDGTDFVIDGTWEGTPSGTWYIAGPVQVSVEANSYPDGSPKSEIDYWKSPCLKEKGKGIVTMRKSDGWPFSTGYLIKNQLLGIIDEVRIYSTGLYTGVGSVPIIQFSLRVAGGSETNYISIYNGSSDGTAIAKASLERTFSTGSAVYSISNLPFSLADQLWLYFRDNVSAFSDASDESVMPSFTVEIDIIPIG